MCPMMQEEGNRKHEEQMQMWTEYEPWCADIEQEA